MPSMVKTWSQLIFPVKHRFRQKIPKLLGFGGKETKVKDEFLQMQGMR